GALVGGAFVVGFAAGFETGTTRSGMSGSACVPGTACMAICVMPTFASGGSVVRRSDASLPHCGHGARRSFTAAWHQGHSAGFISKDDRTRVLRSNAFVRR